MIGAKDMDITEAYEVLDKYFPRWKLQQLYQHKKFDGSGTDTVKKHRFHGELLCQEARKIKDEDEKNRVYAAAKAFENLYNEERYML